MVRMTGDDRRATLVAATIATLIDKGFAGATTRDVAARLGIGRGLIHHYFETWEDLQRAALAAAADAAESEAEAVLGAVPAHERLDALLDLLIVAPDDAHWQLLADAWDESVRNRAIAELLADVSRGWCARIVTALEPHMAGPGRVGAAARRLLALADGLSITLLTAAPQMTRSDAVAHLREAARLEMLARDSAAS